jgi:TRAP-type C4-dicarboxylate transport system permease small subunit
VPHARTTVSFILLEIWLLIWLGTRLWQRAGETAWYQATQIPVETPIVAAPVGGEVTPGLAAGSQ